MMPQSINAMIFTATTWILPLIIAVTLHEAAHGYVALRLGDDTALRAGRISLNPLNHIDPLGTILLPLLLLMTGGFLFGYAKPVPVQFGNLLEATTAGVEITARVTPVTRWRLEGGYSTFHLTAHVSPQSRDSEAASFDGNAPSAHGTTEEPRADA